MSRWYQASLISAEAVGWKARVLTLPKWDNKLKEVSLYGMLQAHCITLTAPGQSLMAGGGIEPDYRAFPRRAYLQDFSRLVRQAVNRAVVLLGPRRVGKDHPGLT
jgi:hypothetical protein